MQIDIYKSKKRKITETTPVTDPLIRSMENYDKIAQYCCKQNSIIFYLNNCSSVPRSPIFDNTNSSPRHQFQLMTQRLQEAQQHLEQ